MGEGRSTQSSGGIGFAGLLTVLFVGLKLTGYITWSWWWVLAPMWLPAAVLLAIAAFMLGVWAIAAVGVWAITRGR